MSVNNLTGNMVFGKTVTNPETGENYLFKGGRTLSFLPLAHAYGCAFDFLAQLVVGGHVTLLGRMPSPTILVEAMKTVKPTMICCVPLVLEKVYRKMIMPMLRISLLTRRAVSFLLVVAIGRRWIQIVCLCSRLLSQ